MASCPFRSIRSCALLALFAVAASAHAQIYTWTGNGDGQSWSQAGNWQNDVRPPQTSYATELLFNGDADGTLVNGFSAIRLRSLSLLNRSYSLSGGRLIFAEGGLLHTLGNFTSIYNDIVINGNSSTTNTGLEMRVDSAYTYVYGAVSGSGGLRITGNGGTILFGKNSYSGPTIVQGSTLFLGADQTLSGGDLQTIGGNVYFNAHAGNVRNLDLGDGTVANVGTVTGANPADPTSQGLMRLSGDVTFRGAANEGSSGAVVSVDTELLSGSHVFGDNGNRSKSGTDELTFTGVVSGAGSLVKTGDSTVTLTKESIYSGGTTVQAGRMNVRNLLGDYKNDGQLSLTNVADQAYGSTISGKGGFEKNGAGTLTLNGALTHTGGTSINEGTLKLTARDQLPAGGNLAVSGTLDLNGTQQTVGDLQVRGQLLAGGPSLNRGQYFSSGLTVASGFIFSRAFQVGSLTKVGPGDLILASNPQNTYISDMTIKGGSIQFYNTPLHDDYEYETLRSLNLQGGDLSLLSGSGVPTFNSINLGDGKTPGYLGNIRGSSFDLPTITVGRYEGAISYNGAPGRASDPVTLNTNLIIRQFSEPTPFGGNGNRSNGDVDVTIAGSIGEFLAGARFDKEGNSVYRLQGATLYTGGTNVNGGTLIVERPSGEYSTSADLRFDTLVSGGMDNVTGSGDVTKTGKATLSVDGVLGNTGRLDVLAGSVIANGEGVYGGSLNLAKGARFANFSGGTIEFAKPAVVNGSFTTDEGSATVFDGLVSGAGRFAGFGDVEFRGGYSPGNSPASVEIESAVTFSSDLTMELAGTTLGTGYDHLTLDSLATLGGGLRVAYYGGFTASAGQRFDLFDWDGGLSGRFSSVVLPGLGEGLSWDTSALYTSGVISVQAVPEPTAFAVLSLGAFAMLRRRRK